MPETNVINERAVAKLNGKHDDVAIDVELIKRTVAKGATDDELSLYLHDCQRRGIHPLDRLLHFTIRTDKNGLRKYTPITSIDLFRSRAGETGEHAGTDDATYVEEDGAKFPISATVTVYRLKGGIRCPFTATARWFEYKPQKDDWMWLKMPYTMLAKCAEALALRKAFPAELGGLYTADEMAQAPAVDPDMTIEANSISPQEQLAARKANPQPPRKVYCSQQQQDAIRDIADEIGLTNEQRVDILRENNVKRVNILTADQADQVVLNLCRRKVADLLTELGFSLDDVRQENADVTADTPEELDQEQANAALAVLRSAKERQPV